jgi:hypothetical protein
MTTESSQTIERVQTGIRIERRILKVLKAVAEYHDFTLGSLLEGIVLHAFEGKLPFGAESLARIGQLKRVYGLDLTAACSHTLRESEPEKLGPARGRRRTRRAGPA